MNEFNNNQNGADDIPNNNANEPIENNTTYHYSYKDNNINNQTTNSNSTQYYTPNTEQNNEANPSAPETEKNRKKSNKNKTAIIITAVLVVCIIIATIGIFSAKSNKTTDNNDSGNKAPSSQVTTENQGDVEKVNKNGTYTVAGIAENCIDSCVGITVYSQANNINSDKIPSNDGKSIKTGEGSGIIMQEDNGRTYILTCAHVISDGTSFKVTTNDGKTYDATMVGYDSQTDIGVIAINQAGFKVAKFANSDSTVLGEQVVAIGCPGGLEFINSVTSGYVSALARPIASKIGYDNKCIQIDAAINPGNSGGALFNMNGQVIGVNSSKIASTEYEGMGFAVPSNTAIETANSLIKVGYVEGRAKIGITYKNIKAYSNSNSIITALNKLGFDNAEGTMVINEISEESDLFGKIKQYDMIIAVDGKTLASTDILTSILADSKSGDTIKLTIARIENDNVKTFEVDCKLIESKG